MLFLLTKNPVQIRSVPAGAVRLFLKLASNAWHQEILLPYWWHSRKYASSISLFFRYGGEARGCAEYLQLVTYAQTKRCTRVCGPRIQRAVGQAAVALVLRGAAVVRPGLRRSVHSWLSAAPASEQLCRPVHARVHQQEKWMSDRLILEEPTTVPGLRQAWFRA